MIIILRKPDIRELAPNVLIKKLHVHASLLRYVMLVEDVLKQSLPNHPHRWDYLDGKHVWQEGLDQDNAVNPYELSGLIQGCVDNQSAWLVWNSPPVYRN